MRKAVLLLCILLSASSCWSRGEYRGRELAIRGMKMVAREGATQAQQDRGWDVVAQGLGVLLSLPGKWEAEEWQVTGDIRWFLERCAWAAGLPQAYMYGPGHCDPGPPPRWVTDGGPRLRMACMQDRFGACEARLVEISYWDEIHDGPCLPTCLMVIGKLGDTMIASAVRGVAVCSEPSSPMRYCWGLGVREMAAWVARGRVWVVLGGSKVTGGTASQPSALLLRSRGASWQTADRVDWHQVERAGFRLDDVNDDGVPEIVANFLDRCVSPYGRTSMNYVVYKLVKGKYRKAWESPLETLEASLTRLRNAINRGEEAEALCVTTSPVPVQQAKRLGWWGRASWSEEDRYWEGGLQWYIEQLHDDVPQPYAIGRIDNKLYRIDLLKLSQWRWRISGISRYEE